MSPIDFINSLAPFAVAAMRKTKIPASFIIAQGALESGWGKSQLASVGFNLFGVKADAAWHGETIAMHTGEHLGGKDVIVHATWRKYSDWQGCIDDHSAFLLGNRRYRAAFALCGDVHAFTQAIAAAGYATDPHYADKVVEVIDDHNLTRFDK